MCPSAASPLLCCLQIQMELIPFRRKRRWHERVSHLHRPPEPLRQGERCREVLQRIRAHPRYWPEERLRLCCESSFCHVVRHSVSHCLFLGNCSLATDTPTFMKFSCFGSSHLPRVWIMLKHQSNLTVWNTLSLFSLPFTVVFPPLFVNDMIDNSQHLTNKAGIYD